MILGYVKAIGFSCCIIVPAPASAKLRIALDISWPVELLGQ